MEHNASLSLILSLELLTYKLEMHQEEEKEMDWGREELKEIF